MKCSRKIPAFRFSQKKEKKKENFWQRRAHATHGSSGPARTSPGPVAAAGGRTLPLSPPLPGHLPGRLRPFARAALSCDHLSYSSFLIQYSRFMSQRGEETCSELHVRLVAEPKVTPAVHAPRSPHGRSKHLGRQAGTGAAEVNPEQRRGVRTASKASLARFTVFCPELSLPTVIFLQHPPEKSICLKQQPILPWVKMFCICKKKGALCFLSSSSQPMNK